MFLLLARMLLLGRGAVNWEFCIRKAKKKTSQKRNYLMNRFNMNAWMMRVSSGLYRLCQRMVQGIKVQCLTSASMISWSDVEHLFISPRFLKTQSTKRHYFSYFLIMPTYTSGSTGKPVCSMYEIKKILLKRSIQYTCTRTINVKFANMMLSYNGWHT